MKKTVSSLVRSKSYKFTLFMELFVKLLFLMGIFFHPVVFAQAKALDDQTWQQIRTLRGVESQKGITNPTVYIFFDPNCPYCAKLWQAKIGDKLFYQLPAVWIPVSYLGDSALGKAAALLRKNTAESLANNFTQFNYETRQGGVQKVSPSEAEKNALGKSKSVWLKLGAATPLIAYRAKSGELKVVLGLPGDAVVNEISNQFAASSLSTYPNK